MTRRSEPTSVPSLTSTTARSIATIPPLYPNHSIFNHCIVSTYLPYYALFRVKHRSRARQVRAERTRKAAPALDRYPPSSTFQSARGNSVRYDIRYSLVTNDHNPMPFGGRHVASNSEWFTLAARAELDPSLLETSAWTKRRNILLFSILVDSKDGTSHVL